MASKAPLSVADAMVTRPTVHHPSATIEQLRAFFRDDHMHIALLVDRGRLIGTIERSDLPQPGQDGPATTIASLEGRSIRPDALLSDARQQMIRTGRRRLAVTRQDSTLIGLLCLKASGRGFCSDAGVDSRRCANASRV